jgi:GTP-binding protein
MPFVDNVKIEVKAGGGGNGCKSFYRDKFDRYPKADGGDGGRGGNIVIRADRNLFTLYDFKYRKHFYADKGANGGPNRRKGRDAADKAVLVPQGTTVIDCATNTQLRELLVDGQEIIAASGGGPGKGSVHANQEEDCQGQPGEQKELLLDLKIIADVGLVGFPNSGKSTLISRISNAHPKIASYPFTTQAPVLGIVNAGTKSFSVADIPGLIKDSHKGKGLGDRFLRHIERTKVLLHLIDMAGVDGRDPLDDYAVIDDELRAYSLSVYKRPRILAANKMDLPQSQSNLERFKKAVKKKIFPISALSSSGLKDLINALKKELFAHSS